MEKVCVISSVLAVVLCLHALADVPTVEIADGVVMPRIIHGAGNQTLWVELGGRGLDTSVDYSLANQRAVTAAVASKLASRSELFVVTKVPCCPSSIPSYQKYFCTAPGVQTFEHTDANIDLAVQNLGFEPDMLILHMACENMEQTLTAYRMMEAALAKGLTRTIGVSNFNASLLEVLIKSSNVIPAATQNPYSVGYRNAALGSDEDTVEYCKANGIVFSAWGPLGGATHSSTSIFKDPVVNSIAESHGKSAAQIAFRWLTQQGIVPVTGGDDPVHMRQNLDIFDFTLSEAEMSRLAAIGGEGASAPSPRVLYM